MLRMLHVHELSQKLPPVDLPDAASPPPVAGLHHVGPAVQTQGDQLDNDEDDALRVEPHDVRIVRGILDALHDVVNQHLLHNGRDEDGVDGQPTHPDHRLPPLLAAAQAVQVDEVPHEADARTSSLGLRDVRRPRLLAQDQDDGLCRRGDYAAAAAEDAGEAHLEPIRVLPLVQMVLDGHVDDGVVLARREDHAVRAGAEVPAFLRAAVALSNDELDLQGLARRRAGAASQQRDGHAAVLLEAGEAVVRQVDVVPDGWRFRGR
mmetsp:Transcript_95866/g.275238  ORF Transcript_95866/g.275238 Transcript_95866/m.275238 type:complete len:263 (+) Transcript_95866:1784-2572(+)